MTRTKLDSASNDILIADSDDDDQELAGIALMPTDAESGLVLEADEFDEQVQQAQEQLLHLRHQQQLLEKQKTEIEELKVRRREFLEGKTQLVDRLSRAVVVLERETFEAQKKVEQFLQTKDSFERHLDVLERLNPEEWSRSEMRAELARALGAIDDARAEYQKAMTRMRSLIEADEDITSPPPANANHSAHHPIAVASLGMTQRETSGDTESRDFSYWFRAGFAFTLPVIVFGFFALVLHLLFG